MKDKCIWTKNCSNDTMDKGVHLCYECFFKMDDVQQMMFTGELREKYLGEKL